ncbi:MBL fold metallo-hydrolase [Microbacterium caowuchunii]|uniref:MBL fold metallo-hydrolase n=1 Tax=Microbacterium caowuchunii TaxID=2614638 RepID=A0A5N0TLX2_9MICO|nr:MBL fold metallo-hydrolase [Microbacterium caowuchunii]KAA9134956.1 MBL fold metallo-hydrolase [Microbacterium caowuchunii]
MREMQQLRESIWALEMPFGPRGGYSIAYLIRSRDSVVVIDPGAHEGENVSRLEEALDALGFGVRDVAAIIGTHHHPDHIGLAAWLSETSGAALHVHEDELPDLLTPRERRYGDPDAHAERWGMPTGERDRIRFTSMPVRFPDRSAIRTFCTGDRIVLGDEARGLVIPTPGHTAGHVCLALEGERLVFTGDHVLPTGHPGLGLSADPGPDPVAAYLGSLDRLEPYRDHEAAPGHGQAFSDLGERLSATRAHVLRRVAQVAEVVAAEPDLSTWELASRLTWSGGFAVLDGFTLRSALAQTELYRGHILRASSASSPSSSLSSSLSSSRETAR